MSEEIILIPHTCELCQYTTYDKNSYKKHCLTKKHLVKAGHIVVEIKPKEFYCEACDYKTGDNSNYKKHLLSTAHKTKSGEIEPKVQEELYCKCCEYKTDDVSNFKKHMNSRKHLSNFTGIKPTKLQKNFQCCWCPYSHRDKRRYIQHMYNDCPDKPLTEVQLQIRLKSAICKYNDYKGDGKFMPRAKINNQITYVSEEVEQDLKRRKKNINDLKEKLEQVRANPPKFNTDDLIAQELERNKCYKMVRDKDFHDKVQAILEMELDDEETDDEK
jgi:hypothetical protein